MRSSSEMIAAEALLGLWGFFEPAPAQAAEHVEGNGDETLTRPRSRMDSGLSSGTTGSDEATPKTNEHVECVPGSSKTELQEGDDGSAVPQAKRPRIAECDEMEAPNPRATQTDFGAFRSNLMRHRTDIESRGIMVPITTADILESVENRFSCIIQNLEERDHDEVPIGSGRTTINRAEFQKVKASKSYSIATRRLLLACFPRSVLATHSLTGKPSPAFAYKPAKQCLNKDIVKDIEIEVGKQFQVARNLVRTIITTKCADENKMAKMRQQNNRFPDSDSD